MTSEGLGEENGGTNRQLNSMTAKDIMTPNPSAVKKDTPLKEIINIIVQKQIELLPVVEDNNSNKLVGVVARLDIIREKLNEGFIIMGKRSLTDELDISINQFQTPAADNQRPGC